MTNVENRTIAVIPTFNESQNILILIDELISIGIHVLVVDDNSPDGTFGLVEKHIEYNNKLFGIKLVNENCLLIWLSLSFQFEQLYLLAEFF